MPSVSYIEKIIEGQFLYQYSNATVTHLITDSRNVTFPAQSLFFAIKGETYNGNHFIDELYQKGVRNFVVTEVLPEEKIYADANIILVHDAVIALQNLARHHRNQFKLPIVGITGSNGKTVVKEWLYQLMWRDFHIVRSPKSYNSQIGVPLSVWQIHRNHQLGIFEAGISKTREMPKLEAIIKPQIGIFTNIGNAHNEGFKSMKQKVEEKLKLFKHTDLLIYCKDYQLIDEAVKHQQNQEHPYYGKTVYYYKPLTWAKSHQADLQIANIIKNEDFTLIQATYENKTISIEIPFTDDASIENAIHCWLLMLHFEYDEDTISERMKYLTRVAMRLEMKAGINNCSIINDAYNSDLNSLQIALDFLDHQNQHEKKTIILSDILESGQKKEALYLYVANLIMQKKVSRLIAIGEQIGTCKDSFKGINTQFFDSTQAFLDANLEFANETILLKGARSFAFENILSTLSHKTHNTVLEIDLNALAHNLRTYKKLLKSYTKVMVMVKAFSYGSGSFEIANLLQYNKVDYLAVAYTDEGVALRKAGINLPIMVMNPNPLNFKDLVKHQLEPEIFSLNHLQAFQDYLQTSSLSPSLPYPIHIKIDTGMHRLGFEENDISELIKKLKNNPYMRIMSVFSHLAASDNPKYDDFTVEQINLFNRIFEKIVTSLQYPMLHHILNSCGIVRFFHDIDTDMVRLGLGLYGIDSTNFLQKYLQNVSTLKTYISQIKTVESNETVGYERSGKLGKTSRIATISIGYGDGIKRNLGNGHGMMLVNGELAPTVGNICMDMCMLDVSHIEGVQEGDEVIVFGQQLPVSKMANWANTIPYEIMTSVSQRVQRVYHQE